MTGHGSKYGRKKEQAIAALLSHRNVEEAAKSIGISGETLLHWMKIPEFAQEYRAARRLAFGQAIARLQQASSPAVTTLLKLTVDPNVPPAVRARAAYSILVLSKQSIETDDICARLAALEQAAEAAKADDRT